MNELPIDQTKVKEVCRKAKHYNIFPIFLPRYYYSENEHPINAELSELVHEADNYLSTLSLEEIEGLLNNLPSAIKMRFDGEKDFQNPETRNRLAIYYIVSEVQYNYFSFKQVVNDQIEESDVLKVYPELFNKFDKDGLLKIDQDFILHDGGIEYKDHILHYHQLLRREYSSNPNFDFLGRLSKYYNDTGHINSLRIAIDHRRLMPKELYNQILEFDTWYGPPFDTSKLDDPSYIGLTIVKRNKDSLFELTNKLDRSEFFWSYRDNIKTFEVEEISDINYRFDDYMFNKYVHSERDISNKLTRHLDGAVKVYLKSTYKHRTDSRMPNCTKCHKKIKLWRVDGDIDTDNWINLITFFYKSNEMIIEYFNPDEYERMFELRVRDYKKWQALQNQSEKNT